MTHKLGRGPGSFGNKRHGANVIKITSGLAKDTSVGPAYEPQKHRLKKLFETRLPNGDRLKSRRHNQ